MPPTLRSKRSYPSPAVDELYKSQGSAQKLPTNAFRSVESIADEGDSEAEFEYLLDVAAANLARNSIAEKQRVTQASGPKGKRKGPTGVDPTSDAIPKQSRDKPAAKPDRQYERPRSEKEPAPATTVYPWGHAFRNGRRWERIKTLRLRIARLEGKSVPWEDSEEKRRMEELQDECLYDIDPWPHREWTRREEPTWSWKKLFRVQEYDKTYLFRVTDVLVVVVALAMVILLVQSGAFDTILEWAAGLFVSGRPTTVVTGKEPEVESPQQSMSSTNEGN